MSVTVDRDPEILSRTSGETTMTKPSHKPSQLQAQLQGQGQGQLQGQAQGQGQGQWQYAGVESYSGNENGNWNGNSNESANGNLNGNGNLNENLNGNLNANLNVNKVDVDVKVDVDLSARLGIAEDNDAIDIDSIGCFEEGIVMPDVVSQTLDKGNNFNIDQVSNLTDNDDVYRPSVSYENGGIEGCGCGAASAAGDFSMTATATGGDAKSMVGDITGDDGAFSGIGAAAANATLTQEAFTQHIATGANIQFNSIDQTVVAGDLSDAI
jgi:hypothetical protein